MQLIIDEVPPLLMSGRGCPVTGANPTATSILNNATVAAEIRRLLEHCGARPEQLKRFDAAYRDDPEGGNHLLASNLANTRKFEVSSDDVKISVSSSRTDLIESRIIDGTEYILIPVTGNVEVNGIKIRSGSGKTEVPKD